MLRVVKPFSFLAPLREAGFPVDFVARVDSVAGSYSKEEGLKDLEPFHRQAVASLGYQWSQLWRAEQVHGAEVAAVDSRQPAPEFVPGVDGLMTRDANALLGIYVADCGLIWIADRITRAVALVHSGRKGTEGRILPKTIAAMEARYQSKPKDLLVVLGPCIRPPHYEVDIAQEIGKQARDAGVGEYHDCGFCTGSALDQFYSYRLEKGLTGRMLGLLASVPSPG